MRQILEITIVGKKSKTGDCDAEPPETVPDAQDRLFSEPLSSLCYWVTILLPAIAGGYLIPGNSLILVSTPGR
jgi:hypothetical protein